MRAERRWSSVRVTNHRAFATEPVLALSSCREVLGLAARGIRFPIPVYFYLVWNVVAVDST